MIHFTAVNIHHQIDDLISVADAIRLVFADALALYGCQVILIQSIINSWTYVEYYYTSCQIRLGDHRNILV